MTNDKGKYKKRLMVYPRYPILWAIRLYQKTLSPDHGFLWARLYPHGYCRYYPTCSEYAYQTIKKHGLALGLPRALWRILRCNPWSCGGTDMP